MQDRHREWMEDLPVASIGEVRLEYVSGDHALRGAAIGAGLLAGFTLAAVYGEGAHMTGRRLPILLFPAGIGAALGGIEGSRSPRILHGPIIYRNPAFQTR